MQSATPLVIHNTEKSRFEITLDGARCECDYTIEAADGRTWMNMPHTYVPPSLGGRGLAALMVEAALAWARAQGYGVRPFCSYVRNYLDKHPQYEDLRG
jgi:uncharacterized protein